MKTLKESVLMRWLMLVLISGLTFATYWAQDFMGGLKGLLMNDYGFSSSDFGQVVGMTTWANMIGMIIVGGIMLDKWGIRIAGLVFGGLAALGSTVVYLASTGLFGDDPSVKLWAMGIGRMMFGSGLEVVCVVATRTIVKWFKGYEMALAMAINVGFGRLGTAMGIAVSPDIAGSSGVATSIGFAASLLGLALIMFVVYLYFDVRFDKQQKAVNEKTEEEFKFSYLLKLLQNKPFIYITLLCVSFYAAYFPFIQYASDLLTNKFGFTSEIDIPPTKTAMIYIVLFAFVICFSVIPANLKNKTSKLTVQFVVVAGFIAFIYSFRDLFAIWLNNGQKTTSLIPLGTIVFTPIFGNFIDRRGKAASLMILGSLLLIFSHLVLSLSDNIIMAYIGLFTLGISFSLIPAAMWPSVAKIVPENRLGTAYSSIFTVQNWGLGLFYWGIGSLLDKVNADRLDAEGKLLEGQVYDYTVPVLVLVLCGVVSIFLSLKLKQADKKAGYGLEEPNIKE
ncbi:MAG: MFS transporter [Dysgonamonadaceae bacterium]|jgi:MFS family permease|nr:MFS transporter [Dysgonamonadaceae bacterium]